ncbi:MAG: site-specific integrase [Acidobacteria bacterium]|nr:site-specific integrase [Acidobacteriota bacterium]
MTENNTQDMTERENPQVISSEPPETAMKGKKSKKSRSVGQLIERGKDNHQIRIYLGRDSTGKRHYFNETFHGNKTDGKKRLRDLITKHERGEPLTLSNDTLDAFLDEWLKAHPNLKESALDVYTRTVGYYVRPHIGNKLLAKIEAADVQTIYSTLAETGLAKSTIYFVHTLLRNVFKLATARRKIMFNPMDGVISPGGKQMEQEKREGREDRTMAPEQVLRFLREAGETRFGSIFTLAFYTGCRPGELLGLRWGDYEIQARMIKIRKNIAWRKGCEWYLDTPKTATGRRNLRLTDDLLEMLDRHRKRQLEERMKAGAAWEDNGFIFCDEVGRPYSQSRLRYYCKQILKAAELPEHFNPYSARHTSATLLIAQGVNVKTVSERLGHSNVSITLKTYTHPTGEMHDAANEHAEALVSGKK